MKRLLHTLLLGLAGILASCTTLPVYAQSARILDWPTVSATGTTTALDLTRLATDTGVSYISEYQTVSVTLGTGTNAACTFQLEGSDDNVNWFSLSGSQSCVTPNMVTVADRPVRRVRINVLTYTGTASLTFHWTGSGR